MAEAHKTPRTPKTPSETRDRFRTFVSIPTRWGDNDIYCHVNNAVYYAYFDTAINRYLIEEGHLDIAHGPVIGLCVESHCAYAKPLTFPDEVEAGLRVAHIGRSSVRYDVGIFVRGDVEAAAHGWFVHVFVDRGTRRATPIPSEIRAALDRVLIADRT